MFCMYFGWNVFEFFLECVFWKVCFVCSERYVLCFLCFSGKYAFYFDSYEVCFSNYQNRWGPCILLLLLLLSCYCCYYYIIITIVIILLLLILLLLLLLYYYYYYYYHIILLLLYYYYY